jgi:uncharacterized membrane protein
MRTAFHLVEAHGRWMGWNLALALVPLLVGALVFDPRRQRRLLWWIGVATFIAFLPNAPYIVSDLVHLRGDVQAVHSTKLALGGVLPLYAAFILAGVEAYVLSLALVRRYLRAIGWGTRAGIVEVAAHLASAAGVVLGRIDRLNSWDPFIHPDRVAAAVAALATRPVLLVAVAVVIVVASQTVQLADIIAFRAGRRAVRLLMPPSSGPSHTAA